MNKLLIKTPIETSIENDLPKILIDGKIKHVFNENSNITKLYKKSNLFHINDLLNGGTFLIIENQLIDFRDSIYSDYCNNKIKHFIDVMGYVKNTPLLVNRGLRCRTLSKDIVLGKYDCISTFENDGVEYETGLFYNWSPFMSVINGIPYIKKDKAIIFLNTDFKRLHHKYDWISFHNKNRENFTKEISGLFKTIILMLDAEDAEPIEISDLIELHKDNNLSYNIPEYPTKLELFNIALNLLIKISDKPGYVLKYISHLIKTVHKG